MSKNKFVPSETRLYKVWVNMKDRCTNPNNCHYHRYGGRGITICIEWLNSFQSFEDWAYVNGYREYLTIDRIDNDGNYEPSNCRWTTQSCQMRNTSKTLFVEINGQTKSITDWAETIKIKASTLRRRYRKGDRGERLIRPLKSAPATKKNCRLINIDGISKTTKEWAEEAGLDKSTIYWRYSKGNRGRDLIKPVT